MRHSSRLHGRTSCFATGVQVVFSTACSPAMPGNGLMFNYLRVLMYSAIALAFSSVNPVMPLLCGALLAGSPLVMCSTILICFQLCSFKCGGFYRRFAFATGAVAACTLCFVKGCAIIRCP